MRERGERCKGGERGKEGRERERGREARGGERGKEGRGREGQGDKCKFWGEEDFQETSYT